jgi:hypothetical protein
MATKRPIGRDCSLTEEEYLAHFGVKGMKWGRRKGGSSISPENARLRELKKNPAKRLTDEQLRTAITRMSLEKQYKDLAPRAVPKAYKYLTGSLAVATTLSTAYAFRNTPLGKLVVEGVKKAFNK